MVRIRWYGPTFVLLVTVVIVMVVGPRMVRRMAWAQDEARIALTKSSLAQNPSLAELSDAFRQVAEVVEPSVVAIQVLSESRRSMRRSPNVDRWFFDPRFFRPFSDEEEPGDHFSRDRREYDRYNPLRPEGRGSGWVYDRQGHIVTNEHVVRNADEVRVRFSDGAEYHAEIVGTDRDTDVAVLKVDGETVHAASIAREPIQQGEIVFAFGSPFRFDFSMSQGIVSATNRRGLGISGYEDFIQTDAAINPGNSGGPLTNLFGQVVGMNVAIASKTGYYSGLGFAIPVDMVIPVVNQIIDEGKVTRGFIGIDLGLRELDERLARSFGFEGKGVLVHGVMPDYPADVAGIQPGDIITAVNGKPIRTRAGLRNLVASFPPRSRIEVEFFRDGETQTIEVTLAELPEQVAMIVPRRSGRTDRQAERSPEVLRKFGIESVATFTKELAEKLSRNHEPGVLVRSVRRHSVVDREGIKNDLLITAVMSQAVASVDELVEELAQYDPTEGIRVTIKQWNSNDGVWASRYEFLELPRK